MWIVPVMLVAVVACGDHHAAPDAPVGDAPPDTAIDSGTPDADPDKPTTLMGTGLCLDPACAQISPDVHPYTPQFVLWADTASKRRWIYLPPGTQIDTSDMDHWIFPMGTKVWKEFTRDDGAGHEIRIETRYISKIGPGNAFNDWFYVSYAWNATQDDTMAVPQGVMNANGTQHDIPPRSACITCHDNLAPTRVLGFGAIQLDLHAATGELDLDGVIANNWLTTPPQGTTPRYPMPSLHGQEPAALGYLHANCGHCHNPNSHVYTDNGVTMVLRESVATLGSVAETPPYMTAVGVAAKLGPPPLSPCVPNGNLAAPGDPDHSLMICRFETTNPSFHMPQLGSEMMDPTGDQVLRDWISNIP